VVSGGGSGFGKAIACLFCAAGRERRYMRTQRRKTCRDGCASGKNGCSRFQRLADHTGS
jgi:NAD(P)-dependent dehydrogenase (short-subunit alcohol dehydrogenase family)